MMPPLNRIDHKKKKRKKKLNWNNTEFKTHQLTFRMSGNTYKMNDS